MLRRVTAEADGYMHCHPPILVAYQHGISSDAGVALGGGERRVRGAAAASVRILAAYERLAPLRAQPLGSLTLILRIRLPKNPMPPPSLTI
jgi:hypothetical protein